MDEGLYARLKEELPPKRISAFIEEAVRAKLRPDRETLARAYKAAAKETWRKKVSDEWAGLEADEWPE